MVEKKERSFPFGVKRHIFTVNKIVSGRARPLRSLRDYFSHHFFGENPWESGLTTNQTVMLSIPTHINFFRDIPWVYPPFWVGDPWVYPPFGGIPPSTLTTRILRFQNPKPSFTIDTWKAMGKGGMPQPKWHLGKFTWKHHLFEKENIIWTKLNHFLGASKC